MLQAEEVTKMITYIAENVTLNRKKIFTNITVQHMFVLDIETAGNIDINFIV